MDKQKIQLERHIADPILKFLRTIANYTVKSGIESYLVGGVVRDIIREAHPTDLDIDLVFECDAIALADSLYNQWSRIFPEIARPKKITFPKFGTVKLLFNMEVFPSITEIDFATARSEAYAKGGQAPKVRPDSLVADLKRRDFTVNAMAVALSAAREGELIDPFLGFDAIKQRQLKVIHERSFYEDPARLLRAVRFMVRLNYQLEAATHELFVQAIRDDYLNLLPVRRCFDEFLKALNENQLTEVLQKLSQVGLLHQLLPYKEFDNSVPRIDASEKLGSLLAAQQNRARKLLILAALIHSLDEGTRVKIFKRFDIPRAEQNTINHFVEVVEGLL